MTSVSA